MVAHRLVSRDELLAAGWTPAAVTTGLRTGTLLQVTGGIFEAPDGRPGTVDALIGDLSLHRLVLSHASAAAWWGAGVGRTDRVHATCGRSRGRAVDGIPGVRLHRVDLPWEHLRVSDGVLVTSPMRTALDCSRWLPLPEAIAVCDRLLNRHLVSTDELGAGFAAYRGPHRLRMQTVAALYDGHRESVFESLTAALLWRHRIPAPVPQLTVLAEGRFVARVDFGWPWARLVLECDGFAFHSGARQARQDRRRWAALVAAGWRVVSITWPDLLEDPEYVVGLIADLLDRPAARPAA